MAQAAADRVDEVLPVQEVMHELVGLGAVAEAEIQRRRGGRPPGARNKRLDEIAAAVRERFGDVLLRQVAIAMMPLEQLVALGLKPGEAMAEQRLSAATVLPYIEQRQAVRVDVTGRQVVHLTIVEGGEEPLDIGSFSEAVVVKSDSGQSDDAAKPLALLDDAPDGQLIADQAGAAPAPGQAPGEGGGPLFGRDAPPRAPVGVVSPSARIFGANSPDPSGEGSGA